MGISKLSAYEIVILLSLNPVTLQCFCNCVALHSERRADVTEKRHYLQAPHSQGIRRKEEAPDGTSSVINIV